MANEELSIFDVNFALNQFSGNRSLLVKMLGRFCEQYVSFSEKLLSYAGTGNYTLAKQDVHSLKGVSGNLGMKALHQTCREFEHILRVQKMTAASSASLINIMHATLEQIRQFASSHDETAIEQEVTPHAPHDADQNARQFLLKALKRNEFITHSKLSSLISELSMQADMLQQLQVSIDDLDYAKAIRLLES